MTDSPAERRKDADVKLQFLLTGFTQAAGIRSYSFEGVVDAQRVGYTVDVDLALIGGFGIRIQELPLLCRELLQYGAPSGDLRRIVLTEQCMRNHREKLATARKDSEPRKRPPKDVPPPDTISHWRQF